MNGSYDGAAILRAEFYHGELWVAAARGEIETVRKLATPVTIQFRDQVFGINALAAAAKTNTNIEVVKYLADYGKACDLRDLYVRDAITSAICHNNTEILKIIVETYPESAESYGDHTLHFSCVYASPKFCKIVLDSLGNDRVDDVSRYSFCSDMSDRQKTPLYISILEADAPLTKFLLRRGAKLENIKIEGFRPPKWVLKIVEIQKAAFAVLQLKRRHSSIIGINGRDVLGLIAKIILE